MTSALQIYKAALEDAFDRCGGNNKPGVVTSYVHPATLANEIRAALEAAAKVGGLADDSDLYGIVLEVVEDARNSPTRGGNVHIAIDVLKAVDAYLRGAR